ncbi:TPA: phage tail tip lysozyme [Streptococcus suis]
MADKRKPRGVLERRKAVKKATQEAFDKHNPRDAKFATKEAYKKAKENVKAEKKLYRLVKERKTRYRLKQSPEDKNAWKRAKQDKRIAKKVYVKTAQATGGTVPQKIRRGAVRSAKQVVRTNVEDAALQDDNLGAVVDARRNIRNFHYQKETAKQAGKAGYNLGKWTISRSYGLSNRGYNFVRGKGFTRTPHAESWQGKLAVRMRNFKNRLKHSKASKVSRKTARGLGIISKPFRIVLHNPLSFKSYLIMFLAAVIVALLGILGGGSTVTQDEFALNQAWLYLSKIDREKSTEKVDYWTNIDSVMTYMNYRYGDYDLKAKWDDGITTYQPGADHTKTYENALTSLWNGLNKDKDDLKNMSDLYGPKSKMAWVMLSKNDREEYEELLQEAETEGYYSYLQELENPFYSPDEETGYNTPLRIIKRFGYTTTSKVYNGSILQANAGQKLLAVFSGTIEVKGSDVIIKTSNAQFTYKQVEGIRYQTGDRVEEGDQIGIVKAGGNQTVYYYKQEEAGKNGKKAKWTYVNPGFYFRLVDYTQTTSVLSDIDFSGDLASRVKSIYRYIKDKVPGATDNGIAAMLGNFATESNITAKRAEGDYLSPPIGASATSWDDPNWLSMNGPTIYNGAYPNILRRGLGLGQWTDTGDGSTRHTMLLNFASSRGKKWYDLELQLDFMLNGDSPYYIANLKDILTSSADVNTLTHRFLVNWEGNPGDKLAQRQNSAKQMLAYFKQTRAAGGSGVTAASWNFPSQYADKLKYGQPSTAAMTSQPGGGYPIGQCTWYVYNRLVETGILTDLSGNYGYLGNGQDWVRSLVAKGWKFSTTPRAGAVMSVRGGFGGTYFEYGHVAFVEHVNEDGTFLISECNVQGVQDKVHYAVMTNQAYLTFAYKE